MGPTFETPWSTQRGERSGIRDYLRCAKQNIFDGLKLNTPCLTTVAFFSDQVLDFFEIWGGWVPPKGQVGAWDGWRGRVKNLSQWVFSRKALGKHMENTPFFCFPPPKKKRKWRTSMIHSIKSEWQLRLFWCFSFNWRVGKLFGFLGFPWTSFLVYIPISPFQT